MTSTPLADGLQRERTTLAWNRTAVGLLGNGLLVLVRHQRAFPVPVSITLCVMSLFLTLLVVGQAAHRMRLNAATDERANIPTSFAAPLALGITLLCAGVAAAIVSGW